MSSTKVKWVSWSLVLIIPIFFIGCRNKEKKNILGSSSSSIVVTNIELTNSDSNNSDADVFVAKPDAIVGIAKWKSSQTSGLNTPSTNYASGVRFTLIKCVNAVKIETIAVVVSDMNGKFEFPNLSPGKYTIGVTDLINDLTNMAFFKGSAVAYANSYFELTKSSSIGVNIILYPKHYGKPPAPIYKGTDGEIYYMEIPNLGDGSYYYRAYYKVDCDENSFSGGGSEMYIGRRVGISAGTNGRYYIRYKFAKGKPVVIMTGEKTGIINYDLFLPSGISDWSEIGYSG